MAAQPTKKVLCYLCDMPRFPWAVLQVKLPRNANLLKKVSSFKQQLLLKDDIFKEYIQDSDLDLQFEPSFPTLGVQ